MGEVGRDGLETESKRWSTSQELNKKIDNYLNETQ